MEIILIGYIEFYPAVWTFNEPLSLFKGNRCPALRASMFYFPLSCIHTTLILNRIGYSKLIWGDFHFYIQGTF